MHLFRQYGNRLALTASTTARADCYLDKNPLFIFYISLIFCNKIIDVKFFIE